MNDHERPAGRESTGDDPGPPIPELAGMIEPTGPLFEAAVRGRIQRKLLGAHVIGLVFLMPVMVVLEFARLALEMLGRVGETSGRPNR